KPPQIPLRTPLNSFFSPHPQVCSIFGGGRGFWGAPPGAALPPAGRARLPLPRRGPAPIFGGSRGAPAPRGPPEHLRCHRRFGGPAGFLGSLPGAAPVRAEPHGAAAAAAAGAGAAVPPGAGLALVAAGPGDAAQGGDGAAAGGDGGGRAQGQRLPVHLHADPDAAGAAGDPQTLHCSFTPPSPGLPFTLQWLRHRDGATRRLLAFDSAANRVTEAAPGALLLLGGRGDAPGDAGGTRPPGGALEVSLQLPPLSVSDDGSFICSVATPLGQLQQVLRVNVIAPPQVSLLPSVLSPGVPAQLPLRRRRVFPAGRWDPAGSAAPGGTRGRSR
uniref:Uncharacterized protein n=1 Tax=Geospiza parvula TaxID=87175 RepID=A0A8U8AWF2_GEOPR